MRGFHLPALRPAGRWLCALAFALAAGPLAAQTTFTNPNTILLPVPPGTGSVSNAVPGEPASPYPSAIAVSGMGSQIGKLTVRLNDFRHTGPGDVDMLLVGPRGQKMIIWSDVGGIHSTCSVNFGTLNCNNAAAPGWAGPTVTLDDAALTDMVQFSDSLILAGTYKPTNIGNATDMFPAPAPAGPYPSPRPDSVATFASVFNGTDPNGTWSLYVIDDALAFSGRINGGWSLTITTAGTTAQPTTTTITADTPDPTSQGQVIQVAYVVTPAAGGPIPTGNVHVTDGIYACTGTVAMGSCNIALFTLGTRTLTATYAGDSYNLASVSAGRAHLVTQALTTTAIVSDAPDPSVVGQGYAVFYSVAVTPPGTGTPTGTVTVSDGTDSCIGTLPATSCVLTSTTSGAKSLQATYSGTIDHGSSVSAIAAHQVNKATTAMVIVSDTPDPSVPNQAYTVVYGVTVTAPGAGTPTGTVTVSDGTAFCIATLPATSCQLTSVGAGAKLLTAKYNGDDNFSASISINTVHQVDKAATSTTIVSDAPDPSVANQPYTVTYAVAVIAPGTGTPTGTVTVSDGTVSCIGTLPATSCQLTSTTTGAKSLTATYNGDANFGPSVSATAAHQVNQAVTTTTIVSDTPDPSVVGQLYVVTYNVVVASPGTGTPTGTVTVSDGTAFCIGTLPATSCQLSSATAGAKSLTATYSGSAQFAASVSPIALHQVNSAATTTAIVSDTPDPSVANQAYAVTYSVAVRFPGTGTPTGTVTVSDGTATCIGTLPAMSCQLTSTTAGAKALTATYNGDANFSPSVSATAAHQVNKAVTTTTIVSDTPDPSLAGQAYVVTYSVVVTPPGTGMPTGTVTISDGTAFCIGTLPATSCQLTSTTAGAKSLTATYSGSTNFAASVSPIAVHQVSRAATSTTIVSDTPDPSVTNQPYTVTYGVAVIAPGTGTPTGTVTVSDGTATCIGTLPATSCQLTSTTAGSKALTATYNGDANFSPSVSASAAHQVSKAATTTIVSDIPDPTVANQAYTVTYSVAVRFPGTGTPTGTVTVSDGTATCIGTLPATSCQLTSTTTGAKSLTATYNGDANFGPSVSTAAAHQVSKAATTTAIVSDTPDPSVANQAYTVTYSVAVSFPGTGTPTGTVTISDGSATCTATLPATSCQLTSTTAGAKALTATYNGDANFSPSVSTAAAHQVNKAVTTTTIVSDTPDPSLAGQAYVVTYSVVVTPPGTGTPTGTVTISDGTAICIGTLPATSCQLTSTTAGAKSLTATYSGDATRGTSTGVAAHQVLYGTTTAVTSHTPNPSAPGQGVTVTYAVTPVAAGGSAPSGTVTVSDGANSCQGTVAAGSCLLVLTTTGTHKIVASYAGDGVNSASISNGVLHTVGAPDLTITKTHAGNFSPGQLGATYTIVVRNAGTLPSAGTVSVIDNLPVGLAGAGISGAGWNCTQPAGPCSRSDVLAATASYPPLTLSVDVAGNAPASVTNTATVSGGGESDVSNNTASDPTSTGGVVQGILSVAKWGSATGTVASLDGGIDCGPVCRHSYEAGTVVTMQAVPDAGAVFTGWLGACTGTGSCIVQVYGEIDVSANFAQDGIGAISLDVDDNGGYDALTDGMLVLRYLFGLTGAALTNGVIGANANRSDPALIVNYLVDIEPMLDIDGNGQADAQTDGLIVMRYLFGLRGGALFQGATGAGATRNTAQMETYLQSLTP